MRNDSGAAPRSLLHVMFTSFVWTCFLTSPSRRCHPALLVSHHCGFSFVFSLLSPVAVRRMPKKEAKRAELKRT